MKLNLDTLPPGRTDLEVDTVHALDPDAPEEGEVVVRGTLTVDATESRVLVSGTLRAEGAAECDRCLASYAMVWDADVELQVVRTHAPAPGEDGDTWIVHQVRGIVDLSEPLRESVLLALPQKRICAEDCKGICAHCGADRNKEPCDCEQESTDPRWDGLPD